MLPNPNERSIADQLKRLRHVLDALRDSNEGRLAVELDQNPLLRDETVYGDQNAAIHQRKQRGGIWLEAAGLPAITLDSLAQHSLHGKV